MSTTDNSILSSLKLIIPLQGWLRIILVGCGGTGSWLAPALARLTRLRLESGRDVELVFCDPDLVEEKNIYRQNFCAAEVGRNKADTLAARYALAWGIGIAHFEGRFGDFSSNFRRFTGTTILCGCVDGATGRKEMADFCQRNSNVIWLDSGNGQTSGQVLAGVSNDMKKDAFSMPGYCAWLPLPGMQEEELVTPLHTRSLAPLDPSAGPPPSAKNAAEGDNARLSCAEMAMRGEQGLTINQTMAAMMADYIFRIVLTQDLRHYATRIDLASGVMTSDYITREAVIRWLNRKKRAGSSDNYCYQT